MRFQRLHLLRFGRFTDVQLDFPRGEHDLHVIYGPNEAGKSTALSAIEGLLFGIPARSHHNFLHENSALRIGAILEHNGGTLEVVRRKGTRDTLLDRDGAPLRSGDRLSRQLGGVDDSFFQHMFSLDHDRLRQGGREILESQNEVGQTLFSASTGLLGLREKLATLIEEADGLWAPRYSAKRRYHAAADRLGEADRQQREHLLLADKWQATQKALQEAEAACDSLGKHNETHVAEQRRLSRIRRVYRTVQNLAALEEELERLGPDAAFPDDVEATFAGETGNEKIAQSRIEDIERQLETAQVERTELAFDETLLLHADDIAQLHTLRIEVAKEKLSLPNRRADLAAKEAQLLKLAAELGWSATEAADVTSRIPNRPGIALVRALLGERGKRLTAKEGSEAAVDDINREILDRTSERDVLGEVTDVSTLTAVLDGYRDHSDIGARVDAAAQERKEQTDRIRRLLAALHPTFDDAASLVAFAPPRPEVVTQHRETLQENERRQQSCDEQIKAAEHERQGLIRRRDRLTREDLAVSTESLSQGRTERDKGWRLVRRRYIDQEAVSDEELAAYTAAAPDLAAAYEKTVEAADDLADRRFDKAEAVGELKSIARQIENADHRLAGLQETRKTLANDHAGLQETWTQLWTEAPFAPLAPDQMLDWLSRHDQILESLSKREQADGKISVLQQREATATAAIVSQLSALGEPVARLDKQPFKIVAERASQVQQQHLAQAAARKSLEDQLRRANTELGRKETQRTAAIAAWNDWEGRWKKALEALGLSMDMLPELVDQRCDMIDQMRGLSAEIDELRRNRVEKIERDIDGYEAAAREFAGQVVGDLAAMAADAAVIELEKRLETEKRLRQQQQDQDKMIHSLEAQLGTAQQTRDVAQHVLGHLMEIADVADAEALRQSIENWRRLRILRQQIAESEGVLESEGDGQTLAQLKSECVDVELDQLAAREITLTNDIADLQGQLEQAVEHRTEARRLFGELGGNDLAVQAAAQRQEALASMRTLAERFVRTRAATTLLHWAMERHRREKQAPLLKRAGEIFSRLTLASFVALAVDIDEHDQPKLVGVRPDQTTVGAGGMSEGTADQLYLALRLAAVEEHVGRGHPLPFVADDLLVNFDDGRATAALAALLELSRKTQVLLFTHHRHLVEIGNRTIGDTLSVVTLEWPGAV